MWRNRDVVEFLQWLHAHNQAAAAPARVGFYGLDLYSLRASIEAVLSYLQKVDPPAAKRARYRYSCFGDYGEDSQAYGYAATVGFSKSCEEDVVAQLVELRRRAGQYANSEGQLAGDEYFFAEQNARLVRNAEQYYRSMFSGDVASWNLRDTHMMETLDALLDHVQQTSATARAVVWAHNSHLGDARATQMARRGELNLGQRLFHEVGLDRFLLQLRQDPLRQVLRAERLQRAIGVIYRPDTERVSHYFRARLAEQFDAVVHIDQTRALEPLERWADDEADVPETYPTGI
jgi:erythromycin esterase-like protein